MAASEVLRLTEKHTVTEQDAENAKKRGAHSLDPLENLDIEAELDGLLSDLDKLDLNDGGRRDGDAPTVRLDDNMDVVAKAESDAVKRPPAEAKAPSRPPTSKKHKPKSVDAMLDAEIELSDDDFLAELGFGEEEAPAPKKNQKADGKPAARAQKADAPSEEAGDLGDRAPLLGKIAVLEEKHGALEDKHKRAVADFDNMRKRMHRDKTDAIQFANDKLVKDLLPVLDNMELALSHSDGAELDQFVDGVKMVHRLMLQQLAKYGLEPFDSVGTPFDPHKHEAMAQIPSEDAKAGTVVNEAQRGYHLFTRLLRPALVAVSAGPPMSSAKKGEATEETAVEAEATADDSAADAGEVEVAPDVIEGDEQAGVDEAVIEVDVEAEEAEEAEGVEIDEAEETIEAELVDEGDAEELDELDLADIEEVEEVEES